MTDKDIARFWAKVRRVDDAGSCWEWTGSCFASGYGQFALSQPRRKAYAHRVAWGLAFGPIPNGLFVCHHCDNRRCLRPDHLFLGTQAHNVRDAIRKGRLNVSGLLPGRSKQTHCKRGHPLTDGNVYVYSDGGRRCRQCVLERAAVRRLRAQVG